MILSPSALLRLGGLLLAAVVLQLSAIGGVGALGYADLVVLAVAGVAFYTGSVTGAASGFAAGVLLDLATGQVMGVSSLVLTAVGYGVGRVRELRDPAHGLVPIPVAALATLGFVAAFAAVSFMLDIGATVSPLVFREMLLTTLVNALLGLPAFAAIRRLLRPALLMDPLDARRRRRAPREAGPLGLRGLEV